MRPKTDQEAEIIRLLRAAPGGFTSGQAISKALGITRSAVWKHIGNLRSLGYAVEAIPSKGYTLAESPGKEERRFNAIEIESLLSTEFIGRRIYFFDSIESTNASAFDLAKKGAPDGGAVVADAQTGGKGRLGRTWVSPAGVNLYTSIILRPAVHPLFGHHLTFLSAVAIAECLAEILSPVRPSVKWPNDVLIGERKISGTLLEMASEPDRINFVVVGVGININITKEMLPLELKEIATSVRQVTGRSADRAQVLAALYLTFEKWYKIYTSGGFLPILAAWKSYFSAEGKPIRVIAFDRVIEGICAGVDDTGALLVRTGAGIVERVISGDAIMPGARAEA